MKWCRWLSILIVLLCSFQIKAVPLTPEQVPEPLKPWIDWVLQDEEDYLCPFLYNNHRQKRCSWPSQLILNLDKGQGEFTVHWQIYAPSWITLPGDGKFWPLSVSVNNKPALVIERHGRPAVKLTPGSYRIAGEFLWDYLPESLTIPQDTGLIQLTVNGTSIPYPYIENGRLWLKSKESGGGKPQSGQDKLDLQVFRKIIDEVPLQVLTRLELEVSGEQREVTLSGAMLDGFIPMRLQSPLPARIEPDGKLLLQVRPGHWQIDVLARHTRELDQLPLTISGNNQPQAEIWVFESRPYLRVVEIENLTAIDPQQTNLPETWRDLPAYRIANRQTMKFKVIRRGDPQPEPDKLNLQRILWLDFNGRGFTVNDQINGRMTRGWRLDVLPEMQLGLVSLDGSNQLITRVPQTDRHGVEVRKGAINLSADSRINGPFRSISATGWQQVFQSVKTELNLPPGWRLLAATGVDNVPQSWISRWTLLDLFLVLIASLAISRLWNIYWGVFALLTLTVVWHEPGAPRFVWLNILAAVALLKVLPAGRFFTVVKIYRNLSWLALAVIVIPFMIDQVRIGIYPQLEKFRQPISPEHYQRPTTISDTVQSMAQAPMEMERQISRKLRSKAEIRGVIPPTGAGSDELAGDKSVNFDRIDPNANVQTGPGLPQWQWNKIMLSWNGPVDERQQMSFWLLSPSATMLLNFIRVLLISVLCLLVFGLLENKIHFKFPSLFIWLLVLPVLMIPPQNGYADFPDKQILEQLKERLLESPDCLPSCAQISTMKLVIDEQTLAVSLSIAARQAVAVPLPAQDKQWFPNQVTVDGTVASALYRDQDGRLWVNIDAGNHQAELTGMVPQLAKFTLPLPLKPHRVVIDNQGWAVEGLHEHGVADGQLQFSRIKGRDIRNNEQEILQPTILPPFVSVERTLQLGLDWRISNRIIRLSPPGAAVVLEVPLLPGEAVISPDIRVKNGKVQVSMHANQQQMHWQSILEKTGQINFVAELTNQWVEVWRADISPIWHIQTTGIAVVHHQDRYGRWLPEWRPWPGEKVSIAVTRPEAVPGQTLTIDNSQLRVKAGKRNKEVTLELVIRSSQGAQQTVQLPENAVLQSVTINGTTQPIRQKGRQVTLPVNPGRQEIKLNWRHAEGIGSLMRTPQINLGAASVNSNLHIGLGDDRWVLFTTGPAFGPAVLFWGMLAVLVILSFGLGKIRLTPLKHWQWLLLLIGLSQIPVASGMVVVAWLVLLGLRAEKPIKPAGYFNAGQVGLGLLTLAAMALLFFAVEQGLLGSPDMQIIGNQSTALNLNWYQDRSDAELPTATVISVPLKIYRLLMLAWSLWLAVSLLNWLKWGWDCFSRGGLWKKTGSKKKNPLLTEQKEK